MSRNVYENNLAAWRGKHTETPAWAAPTQSGRVRSAGPALEIRDEADRWVRVHDLTDPLGEARRWLEATLPAGTSTVAIVGVGAGFALEVLEAQSGAIRVVLLEPEAEVAHALVARLDLTSWIAAGRLAILVGPEYAGASDAARAFGDLRTAPLLVHPILVRARPSDVELARQAFTRVAFQSSANDGARRASAGRYLLHTLSNAPRLARESDAGALAGVGGSMPAIVVAAGPSLDRNIHELASVVDRALVIACDTAARPLLTSGLEPDFIVATDSSRANAAHLASLPPSRSWLVAEASLHPSAFTHFDARTFFFRVANHQPWPWLRSIGLDRATIDTWGSVATTAFAFALSLGCDPIIFMGADFAFTGGRPYCRGTSFEPQWATWIAGGAAPEEIWRELVGRWPEVYGQDLGGEQVRTAPHLLSFRDWIVERAAAHPERRIVNATGAGLLAGPNIEQASAFEPLWQAPPLNRALLHRAIQHAHRSAQGNLAVLLDAATALVAGGGSQPFDAWQEFTSGTVSRATLAAALRSPELGLWTLAHARRESSIPGSAR